MADKAADGLPYGQFGAAIYDYEDSNWGFAREISSSGLLEPVGEVSTPVNACARIGRRTLENDGKGASSRQREKQANDIVTSYPELQPALALLPELARTSEAVEATTSRRDSTFGDLIALGRMYDERRRDYVDALAIPSGPTGSDLRIIQGLRQRQGWTGDSKSWLEVSSFTGETAIWAGPGFPILSIVLANPIEVGERYLAIRLQTETIVFRPVLLRHNVRGSSRLDPTCLFSVGMESTGGARPAHVAFNPWFTGQLAVIDQEGSWNIWEIGRKSSEPSLIRSGSVPTDESKVKGKALSDGWAYCTWVESTTTVCAATRTQLVLFDLAAAGDLSAISVDLGLKKGLNWILDVATLRTSLDLLLVLTSGHITVYRVGRETDNKINYKIAIRLRHHRNPEDVSLRMVVSSHDDHAQVVLRSATHPALEQYRLDLSGSSLLRVQMPVVLELPFQPARSDVSDYLLEPVRYVSGDERNTTAFWKLFQLRKEGSVTALLYASASQRGHEAIVAPDWTKDVTKASHKSQSDFAGFIDDREGDQPSRCQPPVATYVQKRHGRSTRSQSRRDWTVDHSRVVRSMNEAQPADEVDIDEIIEDVIATIQHPDSNIPRAMHTLREIMDGSIKVDDIEGTSARLEGLQLVQAIDHVKSEDDEHSQETENHHLTVSPIAGPATLDSLGLNQLDSLMRATEELRRRWTAPAESIQAESTVTNRDAAVTRVAADVALATHILRPVEAEPVQEPIVESQSQSWDLPVRPTPSETDSQPQKVDGYTSQRLQSPALPTPSASASTVTGSSYQAGIAAPEVARLSKYTTFTKDAPSALPRALNKVLAHWTVGADPAAYDWRSTARQVSQRDEEDAHDELTEKERRQVQRRTERHMRRQRREAEESQRMQLLSSQAPEIMSASQPAQRPAGRRVESQRSAGAAGVAGSSQSYGLSQMAASQVVAGRHGGRPPAKKKRKSGF